MRLYLFRLAQTGSGAPVPGYLIQLDDGSSILIDTGLPRSLAGSAPTPENPHVPLVREQDLVTQQLAVLGLAPKDLRYLVCTHFDGDHIGNLDLFTETEVIVQAEQLAAARAGHPRFAATRAIWDHPDLRYTTIEGDYELAPGVELISTSGHVPGHQSVLLRLPNTGPVLLTIDAIQTAELTDPDTRAMSQFDLDEAKVRASTRKLGDLAKEVGAALVIYGHDGAQWSKLPLSPAFYD